MRASVLLVMPFTLALCVGSAQAQQPGRTPQTVKIRGAQRHVWTLRRHRRARLGHRSRMAVEDFKPDSHNMKVEIVSADHQNKPDIGSAIARRWFDVDHVNAITDVPNSGVALAQVGRGRGARLR